MRLKHTLRLFVYSVFIVEAVVNPAMAGPPFITDDPEPVPYQHWELNNALSKTWRQESASAGIPSIDINYGFPPDIQLHVQPRFSYEKTGAGRHFGIDDTEIGMKYRFLNIEHGGSSFMVGTYPMHQLPTGDTTLGPGRRNNQTFLPIWLQQRNSEWTIYGGTGYRINPGAGNRNSVFVGGVALYQVSQSLQLGGEAYHETPDTVDGQYTSGFNLGGSYNLSRNYNWLFSAGKALNNASSTNQLSIYTALQVLR